MLEHFLSRSCEDELHGSLDPVPLFGGYGIYGTTNSGGWAGYFVGPVYSTGAFNSSDRKLKKNITDFTSAMDIISKLQPKSYEYRQDGNYKLMNLPEGKHYGLIAQDVEQVLPNLVKDTKFDVTVAKQNQTKPDSSKTVTASSATTQPAESIDFKAVNYIELIPIIVKGMQELDAKTKEIDDLKAQVAELRKMVVNLKNGNTTLLIFNSASLEQNTPNPVNGITTIRYHVPESVTAVLLTIINVMGQVVKSIKLNGRGSSTININTANLASGNYNYSLVVDGRQADTKRLIIAR